MPCFNCVAEIRCVVCDSKKIEKLVSVKDQCPQLEHIVVFEGPLSEEEKRIANDAKVHLYTMNEVEVRVHSWLLHKMY